MKCQVFSANEWVYPDTKLGAGGAEPVSLASARGARAACQIAFPPAAPGTTMRWRFTSDGLPQPDAYQLVDVMVENNTGPVGFIWREGDPEPDYVTRRAPFRAYDAMRPIGEAATARGKTEALYFCWRIPPDAEPGTQAGTLSVQIGDEAADIPVRIDVFRATVPERSSLNLTNWFNLDSMASRHGLEPWSEAHWGMIRQYAELMRRARQENFWVPRALVGVRKNPDGSHSFDFDRVRRLCDMFFELGFTTLEMGHIAGRLKFSAPEFVFAVDGETVSATSPKAYAYLAEYLPAWRAFLVDNGWLDRALQYVGDEPYRDSIPEYRMLTGIVRKLMPGVRIIDAVEDVSMVGSVDIWVPKNRFYEEHREAFEQLRRLGDELWFYTCCFPGGPYLNRLLDMPLLRTRYLHWGNYLYDLKGFLHWGFNMYRPWQDPFEENTPAHGDDGSDNLPPGDTHIVYPGDDGPWPSVRLEAQGAGIEDFELLKIVEARDKAAADDIVSSVIRSFKDVEEAPAAFERAHRRLLEAASR